MQAASATCVGQFRCNGVVGASVGVCRSPLGSAVLGWAVHASVAGSAPVVPALGRGEGAVAVRLPVCVAVAVEESSFSRAGE